MNLTMLPNKLLRTLSKIVQIPLVREDQELARQMIEYIDNSQKKDSSLRSGVGIAAVQMGQLKRMFYVNISKINSEGKSSILFRDLLINPSLEAESATYAALKEGEGCLSIAENTSNVFGLVHRKAKIIVKGYSYFEQKWKTYSLFGYEAIVIQHELDHLNGKLFIDRINSQDPWKAMPEEILI